MEESFQFELILKKCRRIVTHFSHSTNSLRLLKKEQINETERAKRLIQDVPTRWNSQYKMFERLFQLNTKIDKVLSGKGKIIILNLIIFYV